MMMRNAAVGLAVALGLGACSVVDTSSRNLSLEAPLDLDVAAPVTAVQAVNVVVPDSLLVSERNGYYPMTDIVWRGDPIGDRHDQVAALFQTAVDRVVPGLEAEGLPAVATITLTRFHGVTERTRYSVGGVYSIAFTLEMTDPLTGQPLAPAELVELALTAPGGQAAVALEQAGQTEKVRVVDFLTQMLAIELAGGDAA